MKISKDVVLADPGILAPLLININNISKIKINKKYDLCIIPHYIDIKKSKFIQRKIHVKNSILLNIKKTPIKFLKSMMKCKSVISSGLHGLIIADCLGIPNMRMVVSDKILGGDYKFMDYYSSYGLQSAPKIDLRKAIFTEKSLKYVKENYTISLDMIRKKQCQLLLNFPFNLKKKYKEIKNLICT